MLFQHLQCTNQLQICNNLSKMNYYYLLRATCLEHQPVVAPTCCLNCCRCVCVWAVPPTGAGCAPMPAKSNPRRRRGTGGERDFLVDWERWVEAGGGEPWMRRHGRAEGIAPVWLVPSVCLILGLAGRPSWMVDGRRQQTWPFYSCLDQIYTEFGLFICIIHVYA